jgi:hypothetical protein
MAENEYHKNDDDNLDDDDDDINFFEKQMLRIICALCFLASYLIISKKETEADTADTDQR